VTLGDIVEGSLSGLVDESVRDVRDVLDVFERECGGLDNSNAVLPVIHAVGNHCRSVPRCQLMEMLGIKSSSQAGDEGSSNSGWGYYVRAIGVKWTLIVLNGAELCTGAVDSTAEDETAMRKLLRIEADEKVPEYYSGISNAQLEWFRQSLVDAREKGRFVIVVSHYALASGAARATHVLVNGKAVLQEIENEGKGVVRVVFAGHDHCGGALSADDEEAAGVQHITLQAMLEAGDGTAYAIVRAREDGGLSIIGRGDVPCFAIAAM
jgi:3',5'-cyclic AMP phosphodiesterase CpdA